MSIRIPEYNPKIGGMINKTSSQYKGLAHWWPIAIEPRMGAGGVFQDYGILTPYTGTRATTNIYHSTNYLSLGLSLYYAGVGDTDRVYMGDIELQAPFTLTAWVAPNYTNGTGMQTFAKIMCKATSTLADPYVLYYIGTDNSSPAKINFGISTGGAGSEVSVTSLTTITSGKLFHIAGVYDGANITLYINGKPEARTATSLTIGTSTQNFMLGSLNSDILSNNKFKGWMNDARIYKIALSPREIWNQYAPQTRWELYQPITPKIWNILAAAEGGGARSFGYIF